jgi:hypothetical protein
MVSRSQLPCCNRGLCLAALVTPARAIVSRRGDNLRQSCDKTSDTSPIRLCTRQSYCRSFL